MFAMRLWRLHRCLVTPAEVADAIGYLCSPQAPGITGVVLPIDAGQRAF
jgi:NAD(P)-dependent dehydrogenase (short-subunit alcohol dehydrogenase family)